MHTLTEFVHCLLVSQSGEVLIVDLYTVSLWLVIESVKMPVRNWLIVRSVSKFVIYCWLIMSAVKLL